MRRSDALKGLAAISCAAVTGCNPDKIPAVAPTGGSTQQTTTFGAQIYAQDDIARAIALVSQCGGKLLRIDGSLTGAYYDALFAATAAGGMRVILISPYAAQPVDVDAYALQCAAVQTRYAAFDPIWEIWNEPNLENYWGAPPNPQAYSRLAIATAKALRAAGARDVWSGGTSGVDRGWIEQIRGYGVFDAANGCAVHSYKEPGYARTEYIQALGLLPRGVALHTTETTIAGKNDQSVFVRQMWYLHRELGIPTMVWAELRDGTAGTSGIYTMAYGLVDASYTRKLVYYAAQATIVNGLPPSGPS
jgi:hypothetical protein